MTGTALIIVDCQYDFLPGGSLAVDDGDQILAPIQQLISEPECKWAVVVASEDFHPCGHISFASRHNKEPFSKLELARPNGHQYTQTLWPDHCIQGSRGARIEEGLQKALDAYRGEKLLARKGYDIEVEAYSAFSGYLSDPSSPLAPPEPTRPYDDTPASIRNGALAQALRKHGVTKVIITGLALDVCVSATAMDSVLCGFQTALLRPLSRGVDPEKCKSVQEEFVKAGGTVLGRVDDSDWRAELRAWIA